MSHSRKKVELTLEQMQKYRMLKREMDRALSVALGAAEAAGVRLDVSVRYPNYVCPTESAAALKAIDALATPIQETQE